MTAIVWLLVVIALAAALLWPRHGLWGRLRRSRSLTIRARREDALKQMLKREVNGETPSLDGIAGALQIHRNQAAALIDDLEKRGLVSHAGGDLRLEPPGRELALHVIRSHRLWESYLADQTGVGEEEWHARAEREEHRLTSRDAEALAARLGHPALDPHGDAIPDPSAGLSSDPGQPLNAAELNTPLQIVHVEDEPPALYAQLLAQNLHPGMRLCVLEKGPERLRIWADGREHVLAPILANNIGVVALTDEKSQDLFGEEYLSSLEPGLRARVLGLTPACRGPQRRRLLDLGFVPGTEISVELVSPGGDPIAFRVRGTVIALRREQARHVRITMLEAPPT